MAYQGARGANPDDIMARNEAFAPEPDLLVILDIEPKMGLERVRTRGDRITHFEKTGTLRKDREIFFVNQKTVPLSRSCDTDRGGNLQFDRPAIFFDCCGAYRTFKRTPRI
jgi:dTMP kinase